MELFFIYFLFSFLFFSFLVALYNFVVLYARRSTLNSMRDGIKGTVINVVMYFSGLKRGALWLQTLF